MSALSRRGPNRGIPAREACAVRPPTGSRRAREPLTRRLFGWIAGVLARLLPIAACTACWPAYTSVLSSLGITAVGSGRGHLLTVSLLLTGAMGMLAFDAYQNRRFTPLMFGVPGAGAILVANLSSSVYSSYAGSVLLLAAAVLNVVHNRRRVSTCDCQGSSSSCNTHKDECS